MRHVCRLHIEKHVDRALISQIKDAGIRAVARKSRVSHASIVRWLNGTFGLTEDRVAKIVAATKFILKPPAREDTEE